MYSKLVILSMLSVSAYAAISKDVNELKFFYYSSPSTRSEIIYQNADSLSSSGIKDNTKTTMVIDGFLSDVTSPMSQTTKNAILAARSHENVIVLDWGKLSGSGTTLGNLIETAAAYSTVLNNVGPVGLRVAEFINLLKTQKNIDPSQIHIIGHSLGAHIAGAAGVFTQNNFGGKINRITGLDPAGPFFSSQVDPDKRLHKGDANFVEVYHTNRGGLGDSDHQTGDINVYVNGGDNQPGCEEADQTGFKGFCSHSYSWRFYDATFTRDIKACPCSGLPCQCKSNCNTQCAVPISLGDKTPAGAAGPLHIIITDTLQ